MEYLYECSQHRKEGATKRTNFSLNGPLSDSVSFNLWGNLSKTRADAQDINAGHEAERTGSYAVLIPPDVKVVNKDIHSKLRWEFAPMQAHEFEAGYSRRGNLCWRHTKHNTSTLVKSMYGKRPTVSTGKLTA